MHTAPLPPDFAVILLFLAVFVPWRGANRIQQLLARPELTSRERLSLYASTISYQWLLFAVVFWRSMARGLDFKQLGLALSDPWKTLFIAVGLTSLMCANQWAGLNAMAKMPPEKRGFLAQFTQLIMPRNNAETSLFASLACTAGISEEFLYRGFVFAVLLNLFGALRLATAAALLLSSILFAVAHAYQGRRGIITTFIAGLIFCAARIWTGNLIAPMLAHAGIDLFAGVYARRILVQPDGEARQTVS